MKSNTVKADENYILEIENLHKWFPIKRGLLRKTVGHIKAVDGISIKIKSGETIGLVGESGCGKTTFSRVLLHLTDPTEGVVRLKNIDISSIKNSDFRSMRKEIQMIFQDPYSSLNAKMRVGDIIAEPLIIHKMGTKAEIREKVLKTMEAVGLRSDHARRYPHEFSGGQRQRIMIAKALILDPKIIICDEPVSALDVSIRSQVLNLLKDMQKERGLTYLFVSHDLSVVEYMCDRIAVMYLGRIVELASKEELYNNPLHPYTKALLSGIPVPDPKAKSERIILKGEVPSPANPPAGCRFTTRCWLASEACCQEPETINRGDEHFISCHLYNKSNTNRY